MIFTCVEDMERVFEEGPYFFNFVGVNVSYWIYTFST
jgi:hypothetical protein